MVSIVWNDGEIYRRRIKRSASEALTVLLSPPREDRRLALVIYYDVVFGQNNFAIDVADGSEADQDVMEVGHDLAGSGEVGG